MCSKAFESLHGYNILNFNILKNLILLRRRTGDIVQYKIVPHNYRRYRVPVRNTNRTRLNIAEKLHLRQEFSNGQICRRNSDLRTWVRSYNNLPRNRQTIRLTRRT